MGYRPKSTANKYPVTTESYNRMLGLLTNPDFTRLCENISKLASNGTFKEKVTVRIDTKRMISSFLYENGYPLNWVTPINNYISSGMQDLDFPLDDGIELNVAGNIITANNPSELFFLFKKDGPSNDKKISIEITSKLSLKRILQFINLFWPFIVRFQETIGLPNEYKDKKANTDVGYIIFCMKEKRGMSFSEIADSEEMDALGITDENTVKTLFYRYKDLFNHTHK
ncbi:MAG: hypothetical protein ACD_22C00082G0019 [uncultured bacterium]|nr:MAG: hypothetical protein ACD_22C00082G0019 [uncultured bacterium]